MKNIPIPRISWNNIAILLGGRAAEEIILNDFTTGAGNDIERATNLARKMVCEWGMSEKMGPLELWEKRRANIFGARICHTQGLQRRNAQRIDKEVSRIVSESYEKAKKLLSDHIDILNKIASELLEKEVLNTSELDQIIQMKMEEREEKGNLKLQENVI